MTLGELTDLVSENTGIDRDTVSRVLSVAIDEVRSALEEGDKVKLTGFGTFYTVKGKTRPLFGGTRLAGLKPKVHFRERRRQVMKEKRAVVLDEEKVKTSSTTKSCPSCGDATEESKYCMRCGTEPWEPTPKKTGGK